MAPPRVVFLMYHELEIPGRSLCHTQPGYVRYILSYDRFRSQMDWLVRDGWLGLSVGDALAYPSGQSVAITFDDGCETDLVTAAPLLKERGLGATFYITTGFVGNPGYMSAAQLRELRALGFELGCHSMTHAYLDDLDESALRREILDAGRKLEDIIGGRVEHFSCPGGRYNKKARTLAREAGYRSLATSRAHANSPATNPYLLGRVAIMRDINNSAFSRVCSGSGLWRTRLGESVRGATRRVLGNSLYDEFRGRLLGQD